MVPVSVGRVRVTVVGVDAQWVQTVTVLVQPSGGGVVCAGTPVGWFVTVGVAVAGQYVDVYVVVMVVNPVGQMSMYEVTIMVVVVSGELVAVGLTLGAEVIPDEDGMGPALEDGRPTLKLDVVPDVITGPVGPGLEELGVLDGTVVSEDDSELAGVVEPE